MAQEIAVIGGEAKKDLWLRLKKYRFENLVPAQLLDQLVESFGGRDASTRAFAAKIARKHGWSTRQILKAIDEYKKFLYLGVVSADPVTPPKIIDVVWHEHLLFSRGYREFCRDVLGREFDHNPELLPQDSQTEVFQAQYLATLTLYHREFNSTPPRAIWGQTKFEPVRKTRNAAEASIESDDGPADAPLHHCFDSNVSDGMPEFGGGGEFSGGGGTDWSDSHGGADGDGNSDSGSSDGGSSCSGGSGCSSSCGGGGE